MKKTITAIICLLVLVCCANRPAFCGDEKIRVMVEVLGDQQWEVKDYVTRALNSLEDVEVVEEFSGVYMHIITRRLVTNRGRRLGFVMASASSQVWDVNLEGGYPFTSADYSGLWLEVGPDIRNLCIQCVVALDEGLFGKIREGVGVRPVSGSPESTVPEGNDDGAYMPAGGTTSGF
ncbi:MAG: hypothetical protein P9L88_00320 [Candidatus Tantalella remota]|nr:hypothetical protein [Candidatus Tantalella remota]